jgi:DNA polymerase III subunit alpha
MTHANFVHLRVHSAYSLAEGAVRVGEIASLCKRYDMPAVAITDTGNLYGALEISEKVADEGVQPLPGLTILVDFPEFAVQSSQAYGKNRSDQGMDPASVALIAMSETGYLNLMELSSRAFLDTDGTEVPHITIDLLKKHSEGLILLTGGPDGPLNRLLVDGKNDLARNILLELAEAFPDALYVELQRHNLAREAKAEAGLIDLAYAFELPLVATNEPYFPDPDMYEAHDALLCIAEGSFIMEENRRRVTPDHYFKSPKEMEVLFRDLPEAIDNTIEIAKRVTFRPKSIDPILPSFTDEEGIDEAEELRRQATEGLKRKLKENGMYTDEQTYYDRLEFELDVINGMKFPGYFLIVSDFMKWTRSQNIPVGVRGSGAASIVAWALEVTNLDPLRFDLVFERFLNPERVSMPDFDIDFCQERRHEVIEYVQKKYGYDKVAQIITFGTFQARMALRDIGRVLQVPYPVVDRICKLIPNNPAKPTKLKDAIALEPRIRQAAAEEEVIQNMLDLALKVEGLLRNASTHAAGLVIGDRPLQQLEPLYRDPRSEMPVTQFPMKWVEPGGLVKFDFLGLKTLTVIARTEKHLLARDIKIKTDQIPFDDEKTFELLSTGHSIGIFQVEGTGMQDLLRKMKPDRVEDLIALVALYRPGPMDSIPRYIACKHGREEPEYLHPTLEPILEETFGVMTYQEDVMQIARDLAGYSLGEADLLRRAMGKKIASEMNKHHTRFIEGAGKNNIDPVTAEKIFDQAAKFASYGFNKAHATAYAQVSYQTAYLKANYPVEFLASSMSLDIGNTDKLSILRQEAIRMGLKVNTPDINTSEADFKVANGEIFYALAAIKNVGRQAMEHIVAERENSGPYLDLFDFSRRVDPKMINRRILENLAKAGVFESLVPNRAQVHASADLISSHAHLATSERESSQESLFGDGGIEVENPPLPVIEEWLPMERLTREHESIGFYLSGHPLDGYQKALKMMRVESYADIAGSSRRANRVVRLAGTIIAISERKSAKGNPFAFVTFTDPTGQFEVTVFSDVLGPFREILEAGQNLIVTAEAQWEVTQDGEDQQLKFLARGFDKLDDVAATAEGALKVFLDRPEPLESLKSRINQVTKNKPKGRGKIGLILMLPEHGREVEVTLPGVYTIDPTLKGALKSVNGVVDVEEV